MLARGTEVDERTLSAEPLPCVSKCREARVELLFDFPQRFALGHWDDAQHSERERKGCA